MKILITLVTLFLSCGTTNQSLNYTNSGAEAFSLVQTCIDASLQLDPGLNTDSFLVDFTKVHNIDRNGIDSFLKQRKYISKTNLDSLFKHDSTWKQGRYFQKAVIRLEKIEKQRGDLLLIKTSKHKAADGSIGTEIILARKKSVYKLVSSKITWIS